MRRLLLLLVVVLALARPAFAQTYIAGAMVPDLCQGSSDNVATGVTVTLSGTVTKTCLGIHGTVHLANNLNLTATTILVYADGVLDCTSNPATGITVTFADVTPDTNADPERFGTGLLVLGRFTCKGTPKTPFERLTAEVSAGQSSVTMAGTPTNWLASDTVVLPDTQQLTSDTSAALGTYTPQFDVRVLSGNVSTTTASVTAAFSFPHIGARNTTPPITIQKYPHIFNLTRSVLFKSANAASTGGRGHILFNAQASIDLEYLQFQDLGRTTVDSEPDSTEFDSSGNVTKIGTNQIGRYEIHFHHLRGPVSPLTFGGQSYQYVFVGNVMTGGSKWGVGVHDSHYGLIKDNVAYNIQGASFMTEDCSESYNVFDGNAAVRGIGQGPRDSQTGRAGVGFFFRGPNNYVRNNIATGQQGLTVDTGYGFKYFQQFCQGNADFPGTKIPNFPGADTMSSDQTQWTYTDVTQLPILQFDTNEAYGAMESGLSFWWLGSFFVTSRPNVAESVFKNFTAWHLWNNGIFQYENNHVTVDGYHFYGDGCQACRGHVGQDYIANNYTIKNSDIQGAGGGGINVASQQANEATQTISDTHLGGNSPDLTINPLWTSGYRSDYIGPRHLFINNLTCDSGDVCITMDPTLRGATNVVIMQDVNVTKYQGVVGDDFRLFSQNAAPATIVPQSVFNSDGSPYLIGSPQANLTNTQTTAQFGIAYGGAVATCSTARASIVNGFTCGASAPPPPVDSTPPAVSVTAPAAGTVSGNVTLTATASDNVGVVGVQFTVDGLNLGPEVTSAPYTFVWATTSTTNASHVIKAIARDAAGNVTTSAGVTVTVSNATADTTPPTVAVTGPSGTVSGTIQMTATASDDVAVVGVQFKIDGAVAGPEDTSSPYAVVYDTNVLTNGSHTITAVARDAAANVTTSAGQAITVNNAAPPPPPPPPPPDTIPPTVAWTVPTAGSTVSGTVSLTVTASDNVGVTGVKLLLDGVILTNPISKAPYVFAWDTTRVANGQHTLTATAVDLANNSASATVTIAVGNVAPPPPPDTTPPSVTITAPLGTVSGTVSVTANASDNVGVVGVQFRLDGVNLGPEDTTAPYATTWTSTGASNGTHTLTAVARDAAGNLGTTSQVVTVSNASPPPPDTTPPTVSLTAPAAGTVSGTLPVTANASDDTAVIGVQFKVNGATLNAEDTTAPYATSWNTTLIANGSYTLTATARDAAGNTATASPVVVIVSNGAPPPPPPPPPPTITLVPSVIVDPVNTPFTLTVTTDAARVHNVKLNTVTVYNINGSDCGASLCSKVISVTPTTLGTFTYVLTSTDANGVAYPNVTVSVTVTGAPPAPNCTADPLILRVTQWPTGGSGYPTQTLSFRANKAWSSYSFILSPRMLTVTDTRGCSATAR